MVSCNRDDLSGGRRVEDPEQARHMVVSQVLHQRLDESVAVGVDHEPEDIAGDLVEHLLRGGGAALGHHPDQEPAAGGVRGDATHSTLYVLQSPPHVQLVDIAV